MLLQKPLIANILNPLPKLILGIALLFATTTTVQAEEIRTLKDYLNNCIPKDDEEKDLPEECDRLKEANELNNEADSAEEEEEKEVKSGGISGYTGITLGVYFPDIDEDRPVFEGDDVDISTGFGSSAFVGIQFNPYLGTDLEFNVLAGEVDSDRDEDQNYVMSGIFLNPRFTIPLSSKKNKNSLALFISPGIGVSQLSGILEDEISADELNGTENEDDDDFDRTTVIEDDSRFTWQIKGGVSIPVSSKFSIIPQIRYTSQTGDNSVSYFGTEVGMKFDF